MSRHVTDTGLLLGPIQPAEELSPSCSAGKFTVLGGIQVPAIGFTLAASHSSAMVAPHAGPKTSPPTCLVLLRVTWSLGKVESVGRMTRKPLSLRTQELPRAPEPGPGIQDGFPCGDGSVCIPGSIGRMSTSFYDEQGWGSFNFFKREYNFSLIQGWNQR